MFTRTSIFALVAAVTLGLAAAISSSPADARPHGGGFGHGGGAGRVMHGLHHIQRGTVLHRRIFIRRHIVIRRRHHIVRWHRFRRFVFIRRHWCWRHRWRCHRPIPVVRYPVVRTVPVQAAAAVPGPCTCLRKEYLPSGAVLFKDVCTNEAAVNPPGDPSQVQAEAQ